MKYAKLDISGIVIQIQPNKQDGFIEVEDSVCCGMKKEGNVFIIPPKTEEQLKEEHNTPILTQISEIEKEKQPRALRESYSTDETTKERALLYITQYDNEIIILRSQLL